MAAAVNMSSPNAFREDLLQIDPPALLGSSCQNCGTRSFPPRDFCPECGAEEGLATVPLSTHGHVFTFTIVRQAPPGRETPYILAYVDLSDRVRVMSQILCGPDDIRIGLPVELTLHPLENADAGTLVYAFRPPLAAQEMTR